MNGSTEGSMNNEITTYINTLINDITSNGGLQGRTLEQAIRDAHEKRQSFLMEMAENKTERAAAVRAQMMESVWETLSN